MSNLTFVEKRKLEQVLGMKTGYVLDFSDRTFAEFVSDSTGLDIFDERYRYASGSKANRLRAFWQKEDNSVVGKLMSEMLDYSEATGPLAEERTCLRLLLCCGENLEWALGKTTNNVSRMPELKFIIDPFLPKDCATQ